MKSGTTMKRSMRLSSVNGTRGGVRACARACVCRGRRGSTREITPLVRGGGGGLPKEIFIIQTVRKSDSNAFLGHILFVYFYKH